MADDRSTILNGSAKGRFTDTEVSPGASLRSEWRLHVAKEFAMAAPYAAVGAVVGSIVLPGIGTAFGAVAGGMVGEAIGLSSTVKDYKTERELSLMSDMASYSPQIQAHYMAIHPDNQPPQGLTQFVDALRDKQVYDAVRTAATKDANPSVIAALDEFKKLEDHNSLKQKPVAENKPSGGPPLKSP